MKAWVRSFEWQVDRSGIRTKVVQQKVRLLRMRNVLAPMHSMILKSFGFKETSA